MTESTIDAIAERIAGSDRLVAFSGAGLSAQSGVPTFRGGSDHPLWSRYDPQQLASPEGFHADPSLVIGWYDWRRSQLAVAEPNAAHHALARRDECVLVTQNVDDLQERAGTPPDDVLHLHGSIAHDRCHQQCGWQEPIDLADPPGERTCPDCGAPVRPAVVWFGESLPEGTWRDAAEACATADCMLVIGTSGVVQPAASLVELAADGGACIINVNPEPTPLDNLADAVVHGGAAETIPLILGA